MAVEQTKTVNLYTATEAKSWVRAEKEVRQEHDAYKVREGIVAAQIFAEYLDEPGPLDSDR